ncbi:hypothetical protein D3C71_1541090 [compost metagenome]
MRQHARNGGEHEVDLTTDQIGNGGAAALVRHVRERQLRRTLEHLASQMARCARARRPHVDLVALPSDVGDQLLHIGGLDVGADHQHVRHRGQQRDGREVLDRVVRNARIQRRVDAMRAGGGQQQRVAVRRGRGHLLGGDGAVGAALVLDDDALAQRLARFRRDRARQDVRRAARRVRHDQRDGFGRIGLRLRGRQHRRETGGQRNARQQSVMAH